METKTILSMNKKFAKRLEEYLSSECGDYDLEYSLEWDEDMRYCKATIERNGKSCDLCFRYNEEEDYLSIELSEDSFYKTEEFNHTVKYFWMLVSPYLFSNN